MCIFVQSAPHHQTNRKVHHHRTYNVRFFLFFFSPPLIFSLSPTESFSSSAIFFYLLSLSLEPSPPSLLLHFFFFLLFSSHSHFLTELLDLRLREAWFSSQKNLGKFDFDIPTQNNAYEEAGASATIQEKRRAEFATASSYLYLCLCPIRQQVRLEQNQQKKKRN